MQFQTSPTSPYMSPVVKCQRGHEAKRKCQPSQEKCHRHSGYLLSFCHQSISARLKCQTPAHCATKFLTVSAVDEARTDVQKTLLVP